MAQLRQIPGLWGRLLNPRPIAWILSERLGSLQILTCTQFPKSLITSRPCLEGLAIVQAISHPFITPSRWLPRNLELSGPVLAPGSFSSSLHTEFFFPEPAGPLSVFPAVLYLPGRYPD